MFDPDSHGLIIVRMYDTSMIKPRSSGRFESLMDLYERNYMLMRLLAPDLRQMSGGCFMSNAHNAPTLELSDIRHSRYTSTFKLTYRFVIEDNGTKPYEPDLFIRLYHDARSCEVMSGLLPEDRTEDRRVRNLEEGQRLNCFLNKWLGYCLRQGHCFSECVVKPELVDAYCTQY